MHEPLFLLLQEPDPTVAGFVAEGRNARYFLRFLSDIFGADFNGKADVAGALADSVRSSMQTAWMTISAELPGASPAEAPAPVLKEVGPDSRPPPGSNDLLEDRAILEKQIEAWTCHIDHDRFVAAMEERVWAPFVTRVLQPQVEFARAAGLSEVEALRAQSAEHIGIPPAKRESFWKQRLRTIRKVAGEFVDIVRLFTRGQEKDKSFATKIFWQVQAVQTHLLTLGLVAEHVRRTNNEAYTAEDFKKKVGILRTEDTAHSRIVLYRAVVLIYARAVPTQYARPAVP